jgi:hypothetical protein
MTEVRYFDLRNPRLDSPGEPPEREGRRRLARMLTPGNCGPDLRDLRLAQRSL